MQKLMVCRGGLFCHLILYVNFEDIEESIQKGSSLVHSHLRPVKGGIEI
ncbi:hypothetical protein VCRA2126O85_60177 [Vibrio crassostreae]|nr:hypothetical protein VCRA2125O83_60053 [Vibrio crassostreae]CAK3061396.1 hypothetical protein VCRA2126O84_60053 [Vibrio crassostreae]CAK3069780.1 hypothetical protein VCRA2126O86_60177 [Vibrio crassostreae]CAK3071816.1 hypothetical protein VCRA2126O85_60177 [Vibrio crassostreae]CAK3071956.1 hypothetical protein VCRA2128O106_60178 [Vibrio crassostreae]